MRRVLYGEQGHTDFETYDEFWRFTKRVHWEVRSAEMLFRIWHRNRGGWLGTSHGVDLYLAERG